VTDEQEADHDAQHQQTYVNRDRCKHSSPP
jgi:hypothetical protein